MKLLKSPIKLSFILFLSTNAIASPVSAATTPIEKTIEARQAGFDIMGKAMKAMRRQMTSSRPNLEILNAASQDLAIQALQLKDWFPLGSGPESKISTDALPYIWQNPSKFSAITEQLVTTSQALVEATAAANIGLINAKLMALKDNCSSCHESFRAD
jgi:cytochrome c556